jgi:hypothetical protein
MFAAAAAAAAAAGPGRSYTRETAIPKELAQRIAKLETDAYVVRERSRRSGSMHQCLST